jgi:hypothetical protein
VQTNFKQYVSDMNRRSIFHGIPMQYLEELTSVFRRNNFRIRIKYRGPRNTPADFGRSILARQGTCLKQNAKSFAIYYR